MAEPSVRRRNLWGVTALLGIIGIFSTALLTAALPLRPRPFNSGIWKSINFDGGPFGGVPRGEIRRVRMVDDLLRSHLRIGMSRDQVVNSLGSPGPIDGSGPIDTTVETYWLTSQPSWYQTPGLLLSRHTAQPNLRIEYRRNRVTALWVE